MNKTRISKSLLSHQASFFYKIQPSILSIVGEGCVHDAIRSLVYSQVLFETKQIMIIHQNSLCFYVCHK